MRFAPRSAGSFVTLRTSPRGAGRSSSPVRQTARVQPHLLLRDTQSLCALNTSPHRNRCTDPRRLFARPRGCSPNTHPLSLTHTPSLSYTHPLSSTLPLIHTQPLSLSLSHTHPLSHTHTPQSPDPRRLFASTRACSPTLTLTLTHTLSLSPSLSHTPSLYIYLTHPLSHTARAVSPNP